MPEKLSKEEIAAYKILGLWVFTDGINVDAMKICDRMSIKALIANTVEGTKELAERIAKIIREET